MKNNGVKNCHYAQNKKWRQNHMAKARMASYRSSAHIYVRYATSSDNLKDLIKRVKKRLDVLRKKSKQS